MCIVTISHSATLFVATGGKNRKDEMRNITLTSSLCAVLLSLTACGTLDPTGPYKGDKALYDFDTGYTLAYSTVHYFVQWESQFRGTPACPAEVTAIAKDIRARAPGAFRSAYAVRAAYVGNPSGNSTALQTALQTVQAIATQAVAQMTATGVIGTASPATAPAPPAPTATSTPK